MMNFYFNLSIESKFALLAEQALVLFVTMQLLYNRFLDKVQNNAMYSSSKLLWPRCADGENQIKKPLNITSE